MAARATRQHGGRLKRLGNIDGMTQKNPAAVALGKLGGRAKSDAKTKAARLNAKKGGRPKGYSPKKPKL